MFSLTGHESLAFNTLQKNSRVNFCPQYKSNKLIKQVFNYFDYVVFDSLGFLINKNKIFLAKIKKQKFWFLKHTFKYCLKILLFRPKEVTMLDYHESIFLTVLYSIPIYICSLLKLISFNIVVWNLETYKLFKKIFFFYHGVSIATGWKDEKFIETIVKNEKYIHCFGLDGKPTALRFNLRYDTFDWVRELNGKAGNNRSNKQSQTAEQKISSRNS